MPCAKMAEKVRKLKRSNHQLRMQVMYIYIVLSCASFFNASFSRHLRLPYVNREGSNASVT